VWEISQKKILELAVERAAYICQLQSTNVHIAELTTSKLTSMHFFAWKKVLKTGMYHLRSRPKADAIQFTVKNELKTSSPTKKPLPQDMPVEEEEECLNCGS